MADRSGIGEETLAATSLAAPASLAAAGLAPAGEGAPRAGVRPHAARGLRVGLEAAAAASGHRAIGRYARHLPLALLGAAAPGELDLRVLLFGLFAPFGRSLRRRAPGFLSELRRGGAGRVRAVPLPGKVFHTLWHRLPFPSLQALLGKLDLVHALSFLTPPAGRGASTLLTVHGLAAWVRPDLLPCRYVEEVKSRWEVYRRRVDWLITVSETSRRDLLERMDFPPGRVRAVPLGVSPEFRPRDPGEVRRELLERFGPRGIRPPYVLYVGGLQRVKNVRGLLQAFAFLAERRAVPHRLVLAGEEGDGAGEVREALRRPSLAGRVVLTGHLGQAGGDLPLLYSGADLLVQPSFYEGWASPPLEAMACGTPVVASRASSLPESCGDAALYADAGDPGCLAAALERALLDPELRADLRRRGTAWSARWSWERTARATLDLYHEAAREGPLPRRSAPPRSSAPRRADAAGQGRER